MTEQMREAAQQALTALQKIYIAPEQDGYILEWWPACREALTALRAALSEPEPYDWDRIATLEESLREHMAEIHRLRAALAEPEPVQEPVAWMVYTVDGKSVCVTDHPADFVECRSLPLYTAPPQRPPLSDDEIDALKGEVWGSSGIAPRSASAFARAVERAVRGEKE